MTDPNATTLIAAHNDYQTRTLAAHKLVETRLPAAPSDAQFYRALDRALAENGIKAATKRLQAACHAFAVSIGNTAAGMPELVALAKETV